MMIRLKRNFILLLLLPAVMDCLGADSTRVHSSDAIRLIQTTNRWLNTGNSSGLIFNGPENLVSFQGGTDLKKGGFHRIREAGDIQDFFFTTESYQTLHKRISLYGYFSYHNTDEKGALWNGTYDPYRGNPYIVGDSVSGSTYHKENYRLKGAMAYRLTPQMILGCAVNYFVAVGAKQKDPRPENTVMAISANPSLIIQKEQWKAGIDLGYRYRKEEIDYIHYVTDNPDPTFFLFKGFGFYSDNVGDNLYRFQSMKEYSGGLQLEKKLFGLSSLSEVRFSTSSEGIDDGSSAIRKDRGGDWDTYQFQVKELVDFGDPFNRNSLKTSFVYFNGDGKEYTQNAVYVDNVLEYETVSKNLKFNRATIDGSISWDYRRMTDQDKINWRMTWTAFLKKNQEKYYYIPEIFTSSYTNLAGNLSLCKDFYRKRVQFSPSLDASYCCNLSKEIALSGQEEITKNQHQDIYLQEFNDYTSDYFQIKGQLFLGITPRNQGKIDQIYLNLRYNYRRQVNEKEDFKGLTANIGFIF